MARESRKRPQQQRLTLERLESRELLALDALGAAAVFAEEPAAILAPNSGPSEQVVPTFELAASTSDLIVSSTLSVSPNPVTAGNSTTLSYTLRNQGTGTATASTTRIQVKNSTNTLTIYDQNFSESSLNAGTNRSKSHTITIPSGTAAGTYNVFVILDRYNTASQSNTSNDIYSRTLSVSAPVVYSDLVVSGSVGVSPNPVTAGNSINVSYTLRNQGAGNATSSTTRVQVKNSSNTTTIFDQSYSESSLSAGASRSKSHSITIPAGTSAGSYNVHITLDRYNAANQGGNTGNDFASAGFSVNAATSDLVVPGSVNVSPDPVTAGDSINVSYTLRNQGSGTAASSTTRVQVKNAANTVTIFDQNYSESSLSAGSSRSKSHSIPIPAGTSAGNYNVHITLDRYDDAGQGSNTGNDFASQGFSVSSALSDLMVSGALSVSPDPVTAGNSLNLSYTLRNQGSGTANSSTTRIQVKNAANTVTIYDQDFSESSLAAGTNRSKSFSIPIPAGTSAGSYNVFVILDRFDTANQGSNTGNDIASAGFAVSAAYADLVVSGGIGINPNPATAGNSISVNYNLLNQGAGAALASHTKIQIKDSANVLLTEQTFNTASVSAGATVSQSYSLSIPSSAASGTYTAIVILDNNSEANQGPNEGNDIANTTFSINALVQYADLIVQSGAVNVTPDPATAGSSITVGYNLRNQGTANAPASHTKIQIKNASNVLLTEQTFSTAAVSAGATIAQSYSLSLPALATSGTYTAIVILDNNSEANQGPNEGNDIANTTFAINAIPQIADLVPQALGLSPTSGNAGSTVQVNFNVWNQGGSTSLATTANIRLSASSGAPSTSDPLLGTVNIGALAAGGSQSFSPSFTIPTGTAGGQRYIWVIVDPNNSANQTVGNDRVAAGFNVTSASSSVFAINQRVQAASSGANVRNASLSTVLFTQSAGVHGTIIGGPIHGTAGGYTGNWWRVRWDSTPPSYVGLGDYSAESVITALGGAGDFGQPNLLGAAYASSANIFWQAGFAPNSTSPPNPQLGTALGNCTWYAHGRLRELGYSSSQLNALTGDAGTWDNAATAAGIPVNSTPAVGAIAQLDSSSGFSLGHVAVVESINPDGTITISESSYAPNSTSPWNFLWRNRTVAPSWFTNFIHVAKTGSQNADLIPQGLSLGATNVAPGASTQVSFAVANTGGGASTATTANVRLSTSASAPSGSDPLLGTVAIPALGAGGSQSFSPTFNIPSGTTAGAYYVWVIVDPNNSANQGANIGNDRVSAAITVGTASQFADLVVSGDVSVNPSPVTAGTSLTVSFDLQNQGSGAAPSSRTKVQIKTAANVLLTQQVFDTPATNAGAIVAQSYSVAIPAAAAAGTYNVVVILDNDSDANQGANESNDIATTTVAIAAQTGSTPTPPTTNALVTGDTSAPGGITMSLTPTFSWNAVSGATGYSLYIRDVASGVLVFPNASGTTTTPLTGTSFTLPAGILQSGRQYRWNMGSFVGGVESATYSAARHFQTFGSVTADYPDAVWIPAGTGHYTPDDRGFNDVRWVVMHSTESTASSAINWFQDPRGTTSAHYIIKRDGSVVQMVRNHDTAHHAGNFAYNQQSIGIEHERSGSQVYTEAQYAASVRLIKWLAARFNIAIAFPTYAVAPASPVNGSGIIGHDQVPDPNNPSSGGGSTHHTDPVNWDWSHFQSLFDGVNLPDPPLTLSPGAASAPGSIVSNTPTFTWQTVAGAEQYGLYLSELQLDGSYKPIFDSEARGIVIGGSATSYTLPVDVVLADGGQYRWNMRTRSSAGWGTNFSSNQHFAYTAASVPGTPATPTALATNASEISITWGATPGATSYQLYRATSAAGPWTSVAYAGTALSFNDSGLAANTAYHYRLAAANAAGTSALTPVTSATTLAAAIPATPGNFRATVTSPSAITLNWNAVAGASYVIERATVQGGTAAFGLVANVAAGATSYRDNSLPLSAPNATYRYRISSVIGGVRSTPVTVDTLLSANVTTLAASFVPTPGLTSSNYANVATLYEWNWSTDRWTELVQLPAEETGYWDRPTVILTHGWDGRLEISSSEHFMNVFSQMHELGRTQGESNILAVDWYDDGSAYGSDPNGILSPALDIAHSGLADARKSALNGIEAAKPVADRLHQAGIDPQKVALIGHSNGAGFMGSLAETLKRLSGEAVAQLTSLDAPVETQSFAQVVRAAKIGAADYVENYYQPVVQFGQGDSVPWGWWPNAGFGLPMLDAPVVNFELDRQHAFNNIGHFDVPLRYAYTANHIGTDVGIYDRDWGFMSSPFTGQTELSTGLWQEVNAGEFELVTGWEAQAKNILQSIWQYPLEGVAFVASTPVKFYQGSIVVGQNILDGTAVLVDYGIDGAILVRDAAIDTAQVTTKVLKSVGQSVWDAAVDVGGGVIDGINTSVKKAWNAATWSYRHWIDFVAQSPALAEQQLQIPEAATLLTFDLTVLDAGNNDQLQVAINGQVLAEFDLASFLASGTDQAQLWIGDYAGQEVTLTFFMPSDEPSTARFTIGNLAVQSGTLFEAAPPPQIVSWKSANDHLRGVGEVALTISADGTFSEPRDGGVRRLLVAFSSAIDPNTFTPANVLIAGNGVDGLPLDLSGIVISTSMRADNTEGVIEFSSPLPDVAKYRIGLDGVTDAVGQSIEGGTDIVLTALKGDVSGDRRVNVTDLSFISATYRDPIDPNYVQQVRADLTLDGRTNVTDLSRAWAQRNNDTRSIPDPAINVGVGEGGDLSSVGLQAVSFDAINAMAFAEGGAFENASTDSTKNKKQLR